MNVWVIYKEVGFSSREVEKVFSTEDAAIRFVMDRDNFFLKSDEWDEDRLRRHAIAEIEQHEVLDDY